MVIVVFANFLVLCDWIVFFFGVVAIAFVVFVSTFVVEFTNPVDILFFVEILVFDVMIKVVLVFLVVVEVIVFVELLYFVVVFTVVFLFDWWFLILFSWFCLNPNSVWLVFIMPEFIVFCFGKSKLLSGRIVDISDIRFCLVEPKNRLFDVGIALVVWPEFSTLFTKGLSVIGSFLLLCFILFPIGFAAPISPTSNRFKTRISTQTTPLVFIFFHSIITILVQSEILIDF